MAGSITATIEIKKTEVSILNEQIFVDVKTVTIEPVFVGNVVMVLSPNGETITEKPSGAIDGMNRIFKTSESIKSGTLEVQLNGLKLSNIDDYIQIDAQTIEFNEPPSNEIMIDKVQVKYIKA